MGMHPQQYIHNVASTVMGQIPGGLWHAGSFNPVETQHCEETDFPQWLWKVHGAAITTVVGKMGPSARGRISACGVGTSSKSGLSHWFVNQGDALNEGYSGNELLTQLASYVVAAAIVDILRAQARKERDEAQRQSQLGRNVEDFIHHDPRSSTLTSCGSSQHT